MSFEIALSGINAINSQLDTISNNIANSGTYGFKSSRANFASVYAGTQPTGTEISSLSQSLNIGGGVLTTGRSLDVSITGGGFFVTKDASGAEVYSRVGVFSKDQDGYIVDTFNRKVQGYQQVFDADGKPVEGALGALGNLKVSTGQIPAQASTSLTYVGNMSVDWDVKTAAFDSTDPKTFNSSSLSVVYDSLGVQHTVNQYYVKTATNEVTVHFSMDGAALAGTTALGFSTKGRLATIDGVAPTAPTPLPANWAPVFPAKALNLGTPSGANPMTIGIDYNGVTQYSGPATTTTNTSDGYAAGAFSGVEIDADGSVVAQYSNGKKIAVGTLALATFPNEDGLVAISNTSWTTSNASGLPLYSTPGIGLAGSLTPGSLEQSNVDMTSELVDLMSAQRNYQANTKVISAQDEMMQTLMQAV